MFITIEGIDGAGKTTLVQKVASYFQGYRGERALVLDDWKDPGAGQALKKRFLECSDPERQLAIINTARLLTMESVTLPALAAGQVVIYDRYLHSTLAYQGALGVDTTRILSEHTAMRLPMPDLTLFLDVTHSVARQRLEKRGMLNHFDAKGLDFFVTAREIFHRFSREHPFLQVVDASRTAEDVSIAALLRLDAFLVDRDLGGDAA